MDFLKILKLTTWLILSIFSVVLLLIGSLVLLVKEPQWVSANFSSTQLGWHLPQMASDLPDGSRGKQVKYGYLLATESAKWMGPQVLDHENQLFAGNNLACQNCHLEGGTKAGAAAWVGVTNRFPQFSARENKIGTIEDRINGCMERSMNGKPLPDDSKQMKALVAYMEWLSEDVPEDTAAWYKGFAKLAIPEGQADTVFGKQVYVNQCLVCHGAAGQGTKREDERKGYQYPPLWGGDSYNQGAGMHRVLTAAQFIKANMPHLVATKDKPKLTDKEAFDVAAYINSFDRPQKANTDEDFPDLTLKPVSTAYSPYIDPFPIEQHKYGPFQPIVHYYDSVYQIKKTK